MDLTFILTLISLHVSTALVLVGLLTEERLIGILYTLFGILLYFATSYAIKFIKTGVLF